MSETIVKRAYSLTERQMEYVNRIILFLSVCLAVSMIGCRDSNPSGTTAPKSNGDRFKIGSPNEDNKPDIDADEQPNEQGIDEPPIVEQPNDEVGGDGFTENERFAMLVLGPDSRIFVQNTIREHGLHIRNSAGIPPGAANVGHENGDANVIGHVKNGATGTILSEHKIVNDLIWFEIKWDEKAEGSCRLNADNLCIGWSAAVSAKDNRLLNEIGR